MAECLDTLLRDVRACRRCAPQLPHTPRPVLQVDARARILIAAQAPGRRVHESGVPFDDASGERLRAWMGIDRDTFYAADRVAIAPMSFCYPGRGTSGDRPPLAECAPAWREHVLALLPRIALTLVIGRYAQAWHLPAPGTVTDTVRDWQRHGSGIVPLPHPSPRNNGWLKHNPWFEQVLLPALRRRVRDALAA